MSHSTSQQIDRVEIGGTFAGHEAHVSGTGNMVPMITNIIIVCLFLGYLIYEDKKNGVIRGMRINQCHEIQTMGIEAIKDDQKTFVEQAKNFETLTEVLRQSLDETRNNGKVLNEILILNRNNN